MIKKISQLNAFQFTVIGILAIIASFSLWSLVRADGTEISMCVKQSGVSYVIGIGFAKQECASNEQLLTFNIQGPQGPQGIQGPIGPQGPEGVSVKVYDANDQVIGYVTDNDGPNGATYISVFDKTLNVFEQIQDLTNFRNWNNSVGFYFGGLDCTGPIYADIPENSITIFNLLNSSYDTSFYIIDKTIPFTAISYQSSYSGTGCINGVGSFSGYSLISVQSILDSYARPFRIGL